MFKEYVATIILSHFLVISVDAFFICFFALAYFLFTYIFIALKVIKEKIEGELEWKKKKVKK